MQTIKEFLYEKRPITKTSNIHSLKAIIDFLLQSWTKYCRKIHEIK